MNSRPGVERGDIEPPKLRRSQPSSRYATASMLVRCEQVKSPGCGPETPTRTAVCRCTMADGYAPVMSEFQLSHSMSPPTGNGRGDRAVRIDGIDQTPG